MPAFITGKEIRYDNSEKGCIVTLVDRKSRFLVAKGVDSASAQKVHDAIKEAFNEKGIIQKG